MKVMVIDDEPDIQLLFRQRFRKEIRQGEINLSFALSAEEALEKLNDKKSDCQLLILADINMPGMNGLDLLKVIKENYPALKVFMITAYGDEQTYRTAIKYGADDYINKPIEFDTLKDKIWNL